MYNSKRTPSFAFVNGFKRFVQSHDDELWSIESLLRIKEACKVRGPNYGPAIEDPPIVCVYMSAIAAGISRNDKDAHRVKKFRVYANNRFNMRTLLEDTHKSNVEVSAHAARDNTPSAWALKRNELINELNRWKARRLENDATMSAAYSAIAAYAGRRSTKWHRPEIRDGIAEANYVIGTARLINLRISWHLYTIRCELASLYKGIRHSRRSNVQKKGAQFRIERVAMESMVQCGLAREEREVHQRKCARKRIALAEKQVLTKEEREKARSLAREAKRANQCYPDEEVQVGLKAAAVGGLAAFVLRNAASRVKSFFNRKSAALMDHLKSVKDAIVEFYNRCAKWAGMLTGVLLLVSLWMTARAYGAHKDRLFWTLLSTILVKLVGKNLWNYFYENFLGVEVQGPEPDMAGKMLAMLLAFSAVKEGHRKNVTRELMSRIALVSRCAGGTTDIIRWIREAFTAIIDWIRAKYDPVFDKQRKESAPAVVKWMQEIDNMEKIHRTEGYNIGPVELNKIVALVTEGYKFRTLYRGTDQERSVNQMHARAYDIMQPHIGAINARNNFRMEPICVMLRGAPGIGKTIMSMPFAGTVLKKSGVLPPDAPSSLVLENAWQKSSSTEYWNGYCGQAVLIMDDAFQQRTSPSDKDNDYVNIIRMVSTWCMPLNFADLESKGRFNFSSKLIFGTTNIESFRSEAEVVITEPEAVWRRISKYSYTITVKEEYRVPGTQRLDHVKLTEEKEKCKGKGDLDGFPWYIWEAARHDFMDGRTSNFKVPLREVLEMLIKDMQARVKGFAQEKTDVLEYLDGVAPCTTEVQSGLKKVVRAGFLGSAVGILPALDYRRAGACADTQINITTLRQWAADVKHPFHIVALVVVEAYDHGIYPPIIVAKETHPTLYFSNEEDVGVVLVPDPTRLYGTILEWATCVPEIVPQAEFIAKTNYCSIWNVAVLKCLGAVLGGWALFELSCIFLKFAMKKLFGKRKGSEETEVQSNAPTSLRKPQPDPVTAVQSDGAVHEKIFANTYLVEVVGSGARVGEVLFVESDLCVFPHHYIPELQEKIATGQFPTDVKLLFTNAVNPAHTFEYRATDFFDFEKCRKEDNEVCFMRMPDVRAHAKITHFFMRASDGEKWSGKRVRLDTVRRRKNGTVYHSSSICAGAQYASDIDICGYTNEHNVRYNIDTIAGDCGSPLMLTDTTLFSSRVIIGLHYGIRANDAAYGMLVTAEMIERAKQYLDVITDNFEEDMVARGTAVQTGFKLPFEKVSGSFLPIGTVMPVSISPKSQFYKVEKVYGSLGEYQYTPAPLAPVWRDGELVYPMENAVRPYSTPVMYVNHEWLPTAVHVAFRRLQAATQLCSRRIYTFDESVKGIPEEKFRSIPRNTAPGFPYVYTLKNGKKEFFGTGEEYDLSGEECAKLKERVEYIVDSARRNVRVSHVFVDFLKDELRSPAKVEAVATRLISSAPLDYVVAFRQYFGAFTTAVMTHNVRSGMAPGICCYSDWSKLATFMQEKGKQVFDGDFKGFDSSEQPSVHWAILEWINRWYDDGAENARIRRVLWCELVHSRHIGGRGSYQAYIYQWNKSLPSGHPFTTIVNSMYALVLLVSAYIHLTGDLAGFWDHVNACVYGDDNFSNVDAATAAVFNQRTVATALAELFRATYTPGNKTDVFTETTTLDKVTFLKRRFYREKNTWLCPLELDSCLYSAYWNKNRRCEWENVVNNLEKALEELSLHEQETWDAHIPAMEKLLKRLEIVPRAPLNKEAYKAIVMARTDSWF